MKLFFYFSIRSILALSAGLLLSQTQAFAQRSEGPARAASVPALSCTPRTVSRSALHVQTSASSADGTSVIRVTGAGAGDEPVELEKIEAQWVAELGSSVVFHKADFIFQLGTEVDENNQFYATYESKISNGMQLLFCVPL